MAAKNWITRQRLEGLVNCQHTTLHPSAFLRGKRGKRVDCNSILPGVWQRYFIDLSFTGRVSNLTTLDPASRGIGDCNCLPQLAINCDVRSLSPDFAFKMLRGSVVVLSMPRVLEGWLSLTQKSRHWWREVESRADYHTLSLVPTQLRRLPPRL